MTALIALQLIGASMNAIGSYYGAKSEQYRARSAALDADYEASTGRINARLAEADAERTLAAGQRAVAATTLRYRAEKEGQVAATAAHGIQVGAGSSAEVLASTQLASDIDALTIEQNAVTRAGALRMESVDQMNRSRFATERAKTLRGQAKLINPWMAVGTSLIGSAGSVAQSWYSKS